MSSMLHTSSLSEDDNPLTGLTAVGVRLSVVGVEGVFVGLAGLVVGLLLDKKSQQPTLGSSC